MPAQSMRYSPQVHSGFVILGPYGNVWTRDIFQTAEAARSYLDEFWKGKYDPSQWRIAPGTLTVSVDMITETRPVATVSVADLK